MRINYGVVSRKYNSVPRFFPSDQEKPVTSKSLLFQNTNPTVLELNKDMFFTDGLEITEVVSELVGSGYICLCDSDFSARDDVHRKMSKMNVKCLYSHKKKRYGCDLHEVDVWDPEGKRFLELVFASDGAILIGETKITIGKVLYFGEKAVSLVRKFMFKDKR